MWREGCREPGKHFARGVAHTSSSKTGETSWGEGPGEVRDTVMEGRGHGLFLEGGDGGSIACLAGTGERSWMAGLEGPRVEPVG